MTKANSTLKDVMLDGKSIGRARYWSEVRALVGAKLPHGRAVRVEAEGPDGFYVTTEATL
ncbi:MAG: hypothetical protein ACLQJR_09105 [Stellaceae bacterium]